MIYSNGPDGLSVVPSAVAAGVRLTQPLVRPVPMPQGTAGRQYTAGLNAQGVPDEGYRQVRLTVTGRGHWYRSDDPRDDFHNDTVCRGCGHHGHFDYILDYQRCTRPASQQDIAAALLGHLRPAPAPMGAYRFRPRFVRTEAAAA